MPNCNRCGQNGDWAQKDGKWRLKNPDGSWHSCRAPQQQQEQPAPPQSQIPDNGRSEVWVDAFTPSAIKWLEETVVQALKKYLSDPVVVKESVERTKTVIREVLAEKAFEEEAGKN